MSALFWFPTFTSHFDSSGVSMFFSARSCAWEVEVEEIQLPDCFAAFDQSYIEDFVAHGI